MKRIIPLLVIFLSPVLLVSGQNQQGSDYGLFRQEGIASWYGEEFAGRPTASGEIFDPSQLTAAHPTLPIGTLLRVTNTHNNKQVIVRVNDRGPYVATRILDISRAAAEQLDMISTGTAPVILEAQVSLSTMPVETSAPPLVSPAPAPIPQAPSPLPAPEPQLPAVSVPAIEAGNSGQNAPQAPGGYASLPPIIPLTAKIIPSLPPTGTGKRYRLQVGSYKGARYALDAFEKLKNLGLIPAYERYGEFYRVVLSGIRAEEIPSLAEQLGTAGFLEVLVREER
ncbi:MAG: septal ring lytic transglycosylase RlpA family protein [Spirochaetaceae bacterium]|jgi:rare lipoprotein A|nr:septal ring lytic transglycosylase RlpA family protein [Spirochaetaceae bacterium]